MESVSKQQETKEDIISNDMAYGVDDPLLPEPDRVNIVDPVAISELPNVTVKVDSTSPISMQLNEVDMTMTDAHISAIEKLSKIEGISAIDRVRLIDKLTDIEKLALIDTINKITKIETIDVLTRIGSVDTLKKIESVAPITIQKHAPIEVSNARIHTNPDKFNPHHLIVDMAQSIYGMHDMKMFPNSDEIARKSMARAEVFVRLAQYRYPEAFEGRIL